MGMFDFFKGKKKVERASEIGKISFEDIRKWVEDKSKDLRENELEVLEEVGGKLELFFISLEEKLRVLEDIDIESKKEYGRAKLLVRQGLDKYIDFVYILLKDLKALERKNLEEFFRKISETFVHFEKMSAKVYERATYLVGDEMAAVRNEIRRFYNGLMEMFKGEDSSIKDLMKIRNIKIRLSEFEEFREKVGKVNEEIEEKDLRIKKAEKRVEELKRNIGKIRNSSEYVSNLKMIEEIETLRKSLDSEIVRLKDSIDFKKLTNIIHSNEREFKIVKNYREHFVSEFSRDGGNKILDLLGDSNMKSAEIKAQVSLIEEKNKRLDEKRGKVGLDSTIIELEKVKNIEDEIDGMKTEEIKVKRFLEEFDLKLKGLRNEVVGLVEGFGIRIV